MLKLLGFVKDDLPLLLSTLSISLTEVASLTYKAYYVSIITLTREALNFEYQIELP
jgi:hypothetical protein